MRHQNINYIHHEAPTAANDTNNEHKQFRPLEAAKQQDLQYTHARTHAHSHARTHARTHTRTQRKRLLFRKQYIRNLINSSNTNNLMINSNDTMNISNNDNNTNNYKNDKIIIKSYRECR